MVNWQLIRHRSAGAAAGLLVVSTLLVSGCAPPAQTSSEPRSGRAPETTLTMRLDGRDFTLHLIPPSSERRTGPLVLYASGDGGWFGAAVGMFRTLGETGAPVVGFSSKAFMSIEQARARPVTSAQIVDAYQQILAKAREALHLPAGTPTVITGWSRGASLGVLVASSAHADPAILGVVAIGLASDEELDASYDSDDDSAAQSAPAADPPPGTVRTGTYARIPEIAPRRCVVIQSTHDGYLAASRAKALFGEDSDVKRFIAIEAKNHRFSGGEAPFSLALTQAVNWVSAKAEK